MKSGSTHSHYIVGRIDPDFIPTYMYLTIILAWKLGIPFQFQTHTCMFQSEPHSSKRIYKKGRWTSNWAIIKTFLFKGNRTPSSRSYSDLGTWYLGWLCFHPCTISYSSLILSMDNTSMVQRLPRWLVYSSVQLTHMPHDQAMATDGKTNALITPAPDVSYEARFLASMTSNITSARHFVKYR